MRIQKTITLLAVLLSSSSSYATELTYGFKNPSFSGVNASSHWLTIDNQESTRVKQIADDIKAALEAKAAAAQNTILAKFINNLESRIYSQLAAQLTSNLFGETPQNSGTFTLDGNTISYVKDPTGQTLTMTITDSNKNITTITIPLTGFTF